MGREDIGAMISSALDALEEKPERAEPAQRLIERYAALVREDESGAEASGEVALPVSPAAPPPSAAPARPLASTVRRLLGRMRR